MASISFKDILAWQKAHEFVIKVYKTTKTFPEWERYGLCSQFQRTVVSIPANIAEGYKRLGTADKLHFMNIAQGSLEECRYYVLLTKDIGYINQHTHDVLNADIEEVSKLLNGYCKGITHRHYVK
ncbi:MAG: four helix bundle protein [Prevotella sp.]